MIRDSREFIDLFSGIGGFHRAMMDLGGTCVFASEIDKDAIDTYAENYGMNSNHNINDVSDEEIPNHKVLCAGFPCQAFSKAGKQMGFDDPTKGTLFFQIKRILEAKHPDYIMLENVRNLLAHDKGKTYEVISDTLHALGYNIGHVVISPHQLGVPQLRERVYILGVRNDLYDGELKFNLPDTKKGVSTDVYDSGILDDKVDDKYHISKYEESVLSCWDEFYKSINLKVIGFPIWASEFGATYSLDGLPSWKQNICIKNRKLYADNKKFICKWLKRWNNLADFTPTCRKFEWQAGTSISSVWDGIIQFRPSGVRVKKPDCFPALVAMVQIPIIGRYKRRLTPREAARLQSFPETFIINKDDFQAYKQFGNAVNVECVKYLAKQLFRY